MEKYQWTFCSLGGVARVAIRNGEDIKHLSELDGKLWTVLSMPVKALEFDAKTLALVDKDNDGRIRVNEMVSTAQYLCKVLKNADDLFKREDRLALTALSDSAEAKVLMDAAALLEKDSLSLKDVAELNANLAVSVAALESPEAPVAPYGEQTAAVAAAVSALKTKVSDFFMRCQLIAFNENCAASVDTSLAKIAAISNEDMSACAAQIAECPLAQPNKDLLLPVDKGINPALAASFAVVAKNALAVDYPKAEAITQEQWLAVEAKLSAYAAAVEAQTKEQAAIHDQALSARKAAIDAWDNFLHLYRDYHRLLCNFVIMSDFYSKDTEKQAIFQAGKLLIDQRCCELCIEVTDMAKHGDMAGLSGMYLIYCTCTSKTKNQTRNVVAVLTDGDVDGLRVGKNAIFYDRNGLDWDAVITKIIDNPISIAQAFWSPYKKLARWINDKITKAASDKDSKITKDLTAGTDKMMANAGKAPATAAAPAANTAQAFDIAKFCGIFAAIGMAIGYIGGFLTQFAQGLLSLGWLMPLGIIAIFLLISGPSMFIAWSKLKKRDLGPVLNANGWAINARILVNMAFGATLTSLAKYPNVLAMAAKDPYAKQKKRGRGWYWALAILLIIVGAAVALYVTGHLPFLNNLCK